MKDKVDVVITDSPILLSIIYDKTGNKYFSDLVLNQFNNFDNRNYFIERTTVYNPKGRLQTEDEAKEIDKVLLDLLKDCNIEYDSVGKSEAVDYIFNKIMKEL